MSWITKRIVKFFTRKTLMQPTGQIDLKAEVSKYTENFSCFPYVNNLEVPVDRASALETDITIENGIINYTFKKHNILQGHWKKSTTFLGKYFEWQTPAESFDALDSWYQGNTMVSHRYSYSSEQTRATHPAMCSDYTTWGTDTVKYYTLTRSSTTTNVVTINTAYLRKDTEMVLNLVTSITTTAAASTSTGSDGTPLVRNFETYIKGDVIIDGKNFGSFDNQVTVKYQTKTSSSVSSIKYFSFVLPKGISQKDTFTLQLTGVSTSNLSINYIRAYISYTRPGDNYSIEEMIPNSTLVIAGKT